MLFAIAVNIQINVHHEKYTQRVSVDLQKASDAVVLKVPFTPKTCVL